MGGVDMVVGSRGVARVICVDDDDSVARLVARMVEFNGHEAIILTDSMEVVAQLRILRPRAVLADYMMPKLDGIELLNIVQEQLPGCRRVLITAAPNEQAVREAVASGVVRMVLAKPPSLADMEKALGWLDEIPDL